MSDDKNYEALKKTLNELLPREVLVEGLRKALREERTPLFPGLRPAKPSGAEADPALADQDGGEPE